jgi:Acetyltransferase (GNAT) domain
MTRKDALRQNATLCLDDDLLKTEPLGPPTIFHEPWWLDVTTQGRVETVESHEHGKVVGRLYYLPKNRFGIISSNMPPFTHFLGPAIDPGRGSPLTRHLKTLSITADLIEKLPRCSAFRQKMHRGITDVLAFQAAAFDAFVQFTYEIPPDDERTIWSRMRDKTRNAIRNGDKLHSIMDTLDPDGFIDFYRRNVKSIGLTENVDLEIARRLTRRCLEQQCGKFLVAKDESGADKAAIFIVWDQHSCYYLMSTRAPDSSSGAIPVLLWAAIKFALASGRIFDFDGAISEGSVKLFLGFGSAISPRYIVERSTSAYKLLRVMRRGLSDTSNPYC